MRLNILPLLLLLTVNIGIDSYIYRQLKRVFRQRWIPKIHLLVSLAGIAVLAAIMAIPASVKDDSRFMTLMWLLLCYFSIYVPKYIFTVFDLLGKIPLLFKHRPLVCVSIAGAILGAATFVIMWWGALVNRFRTEVVRVTVEIPGLPSSFNGYRIVHISDLHVGTYGNDTAFVDSLVKKINSLDPDLILFTGDIVNRHAEELAPFTNVLGRLKAKDGEFAILGNHDYGDYYDFASDTDRLRDRLRLKELYSLTSFELLDNGFKTIRHGADSIEIIGVGNIGAPPFSVYGSLAKAYPDIDNNATKILMTHDPSHWLDSIAENPEANISLTLSGHTHAMQIKVGRLSPASIRHKAWGGLYKNLSGEHLLYVNIGTGTVGPPMRIGATPEITLITLRKK